MGAWPPTLQPVVGNIHETGNKYLPATDLPVNCLFLFSSHFLKCSPFTLFHSSVSTVLFFSFGNQQICQEYDQESQSPSVAPNVLYSLHSRKLVDNVFYPLTAIALVLASKAPTVRGAEPTSQALRVGKLGRENVLFQAMDGSLQEYLNSIPSQYCKVEFPSWILKSGQLEKSYSSY